MVSRVLVGGVLLASLSACGSGGVADPAEAVRAWANAMGRGDAATMKRLMVSPERIRRALDCTGDQNLVVLVEQAHRSYERGRMTDMGLVFSGLDEKSVVTIERGATFRDCTARRPFEVRAYSFGMSGSRGNAGYANQEVILLDGGWFILPFR